MKFDSIFKSNPLQSIVEFSDEILTTAQDKNSILASGEVNFLYRDHYVDASKGICGIEQMLIDILRENNAIFPMGSEITPNRNQVVSGSLSFREILSQVRQRFGPNRYPAETLRVYLSNNKTKQGELHKFGCVQLTKHEDPCGKKPRAKYYLVKEYVISE